MAVEEHADAGPADEGPVGESYLDEDDALLRDIPTISGKDEREDVTPERHAQLSLISKLSKDLEEFEKNISQNEFHLRHTREKLSSFKSFVEHADVEFDEIHRLRKQRSDLSRDLASEAALNKELQRALEMERANVTAIRERMDGYRTVLEDARKEIVNLGERDRRHREKIDDLTDAVAKREARLQELVNRSERLSAESQGLKDNNERMNTALARYKEAATALAKKVDDLIEMGAKAQEEIDRLTASLTVANESLDGYQAENVHLQSQLDNVLAEKKALERRISDKVRIREEEVFSLRSRIDGIQSELRIKDQLLAQTTDEVKAARTGQEAAESSVKGLTEQIAREVRQREEYRDRLTASNNEIAEVNERFKGLMEELEQARRENLVLQRMLKAERQKVELAVNSVPGTKLSTQDQQKLLDELGEAGGIKPN